MVSISICGRTKIVALILAASSSAFPAEQVLEEIMVTAQKRTEGLQDIPIAISAFSGEELSDFVLEQNADLGSITPGLMTNTTIGGANIANFQIRGIGGGDILAGVESRVGLYFDGVYYGGTVGSMTSLVDLERVEVLRGPQGTLYGRNNTGGAINFISKKPLGKAGFKQDFTVANHGEWRSLTTVDTPSMGNVSAKLSFAYEEQDEYNDNDSPIPEVAKLDIGSFENQGLRAAVRWVPTETLTIDYVGDYQDREAVPHPGQFLGIGPNSPFYGVWQAGIIEASTDRIDAPSPGTATVDTAEITGHALTIEKDFGFATLRSITSWRDIDTDRTGNEVDGTIVDAFFTKSVESNDHEQFTQELTLLGNIGERVNYIAGIFYYDSESDSEEILWQATTAEGITDLTNAPPNLKTTSRFTETESIAVYGQMTYTPALLDDNLDITFGLRWTDDEKDMEYYDPSIITSGYTLDSPLEVSDSWGSTDPMITFDYNWNDDVSTFVKWSQAYNSGGYNQRARGTLSDGLTPLAFMPFDEEELEAWEIGLKSHLIDQRMRLNAVAFFYDYTDQQVQGPIGSTGGGASFSLINAGASEIKGLELEVTALVTDRLTLTAHYAYLDPEYKEYPGPDGSNVVGLLTPAFAPEHSAMAGIAYDFQPFSFGQLSWQLNVDYRDEAVASNAEQDAFREELDIGFDERTLVNTRLTLSQIELGSGIAMVSLWGRNIFDEEYRNWPTGVQALDLAIVSYTEPSSYGVDLVWEWRL